jgi:hypothetical protein
MITLSYGVTHTSCDWPSELFGVIRCTITEGPDYFLARQSFEKSPASAELVIKFTDTPGLAYTRPARWPIAFDAARNFYGEGESEKLKKTLFDR